jgi:DNA-directed RNA polymerase subunit RPC12/RpoP
MKPVPVTEIPPGPLSKETLDKILNFDNWAVEEFFTSTDGITCPHCKKHFPGRPPERFSPGPWMCWQCGKKAQLDVVKTPLGNAWRTQKLEGEK